MTDYSIPVAFGAGVLSFLSPCVLPLVPVYLANLGGATSLSSEAKRIPIFLNAISFVLGFSIVFIVLGTSLGLLGTIFPTNLLHKIGGSILVIFGVFLLATNKIPWLNYEMRVNRSFNQKTGYLRSMLIGGAFSLAWTPCVGPILGGILTLAATSQTAWTGLYLLSAYSLGMGVPFIVIALALGSALPVVRWLSRRSLVISIFSGVLLIVVGALMLSNNLFYLYIDF